MTKVDIISGFLGAGKTTLIKKMLAGPLKGQQVVLIENEFGEIGIDGGFLKDAGIEIREMNSGCICCSLVGDFSKALAEVIQTYHPDRIIIEPSGVGKLSDVINAVNDTKEDIQLNSATTVVDVTKGKLYAKNFGEFFENQIEAASTVILSRTDLEKVTEEKISEVIGIVKKLNENAVIITTPIEKLEGEKLLDTMEGNCINLAEAGLEHEGHCSCGCHDHGHHHHHEHCNHEHHHADDVFGSWGRETVQKYGIDEIRAILEQLENGFGTVLRAKGMVEGNNEEWIYFDMVPGEIEVRAGKPEYTGRICVIGTELNEDKLEDLFGVRE